MHETKSKVLWILVYIRRYYDAKSRKVVHERLFKATHLPLIDLEREAAWIELNPPRLVFAKQKYTKERDRHTEERWKIQTAGSLCSGQSGVIFFVVVVLFKRNIMSIFSTPTDTSIEQLRIAVIRFLYAKK